jgi:hypothetical protein
MVHVWARKLCPDSIGFVSPSGTGRLGFRSIAHVDAPQSSCIFRCNIFWAIGKSPCCAIEGSMRDAQFHHPNRREKYKDADTPNVEGSLLISMSIMTSATSHLLGAQCLSLTLKNSKIIRDPSNGPWSSMPTPDPPIPRLVPSQFSSTSIN